MSIITISRGSYSHSKEVAEKLAQKLSYECISREVLLRASEKFNIMPIKVAQVIQRAPYIFDRITLGKEKYMAYMRAALLDEAQKDNIVYYDLAASHFLLQGIPHVLKVNIIADMEDRVAEQVRRRNMSAEEARKKLHINDEKLRKWSLQLYGLDFWDPILYDLVIRIKPMTVDDAAELISSVVKLPYYQTTPQSREILGDLLLAAQVEAALVEEFPAATVNAKEGKALVVVEGYAADKKVTIDRIRELAKEATGILAEVRYQEDGWM
jgi:cytidylate kinase